MARVLLAVLSLMGTATSVATLSHVSEVLRPGSPPPGDPQGPPPPGY